MTTFRLLLFSCAAILGLLAQPALAQAAPPPSEAPAAPPSKYHYTFFWGLWSNYDKPALRTRAHFKADFAKPVTSRQFQALRTAAKPDSTYQTRRILGGAVQWTEKRPTPTR
ncbi:MAG TPA: hypothetical protein VF690_20685 [Hymenobacter sp.]